MRQAIKTSGLLGPGNAPGLRRDLRVIWVHLAPPKISGGFTRHELNAGAALIAFFGAVLIQHRLADTLIFGGYGGHGNQRENRTAEFQDIATRPFHIFDAYQKII